MPNLRTTNTRARRNRARRNRARVASGFSFVPVGVFILASGTIPEGEADAPLRDRFVTMRV